MIKIGIYSNDSAQKRDIKKFMVEYFENLNIEFEISYIRTKSKVLKNITDKFMKLNIVMICDADKIIYVKRNDISIGKSSNYQAIGWIDSPLNNEKIDEIIFNEGKNNCPHGLFQLNTRKVIRAIEYEDIEYIKKVERKTLIYLTDNETEETNEAVKSIKSKLSEEFFADCIRGHLINFYNIKKIDRVNHILVMKSGHEILIGKNKFTHVLRLYIRINFGI